MVGRRCSPGVLAGLVVLGALGIGGCRTVVVESRWDEMGSLVADLSVDHGLLDTRGEGRFRAIRIEVANADLEMYVIKVTFGNGDPFIPSIRHHFQQGSSSRVIDLPGGYRHIRRIEFWYKAAQLAASQARIVLWGLR